MADSMTEACLENNERYASGQTIHNPGHPGKQPIQPGKRLAIVACMDARLDVEDLLGLQTGDAHVIRNAGGVVTDDVIRCLIISHHLLNTNEVILIHHTRCGMLAFTDDLLKAGLEGDPAAEKLVAQATGAHSSAARSARRRRRRFTPSVGKSSRSMPRATRRTWNASPGTCDAGCRPS